MQSHVNGDIFPQVPESVGKRPAMLVYEGASAGVAKKRWVEEHRSRTRLSDKLSLRPPLVGVWPWQLSGEIETTSLGLTEACHPSHLL